jgi:hypothetical protein
MKYVKFKIYQITNLLQTYICHKHPNKLEPKIVDF